MTASSIQRVLAEPRLTDTEADALCGWRLTADAYDSLLRKSVALVRPDGSLLAVYLREALPEQETLDAYPVFRAMNTHPGARFISTIGRRPDPYIKADGTKSTTVFIPQRDMPKYGLKGAVSGVMGYMDRYPRMPYCRTTAFNMDHADLFAKAMPYVRSVDTLFAEHAPVRYAAQEAACDATSRDFIIPGTVFTTITVNRNYPTRVHKDEGDLKEGFGVLSVFRKGSYQGAHFVLPKYRVAFDLGNRDLLLCDVHEWHGNTEMLGDRRKAERISCVFYYREKMGECGTAAEELQRAKTVRSPRVEADE